MKLLTEREEQVRLVARFLMEEYGVSNLNLTFRRMKKTLGQFSNGRQQIKLSTYFIANKSYRIIINTILHEIAHALTPGQGHNKLWKDKAEELGALPKARANDTERLKWIQTKEDK